MGKRRMRFTDYGRSSRFKIIKLRQQNRRELRPNETSDEEQGTRENNAPDRTGPDAIRDGSDTDSSGSSSNGREAHSGDSSSSDSDRGNDRSPVPSPAPSSSLDDSSGPDGERSTSSESSEVDRGPEDFRQHDSPPDSPDDSPGSDDQGSPPSSGQSSSEDESESESEGEHSEDDDGVNNALFPGAPLTIAESMLSILSMSLTHNLSGTCLEDMLGLISLHCPQTNRYQRSLYMFKKFFCDMRSPLQRNYFCKECYTPLANERDLCHVCNERKGVNYFISISLISQLQSLFNRPGFAAKLAYRFERRKQVLENIEDIFDGTIFQELSSVGNVLHNRSSLGLFWCTDGIPTSASSKCSIWPFYLSILNLPYRDRTKLDNVLLAGLWYGYQKPFPNLFLRPLADEIQTLHGGIRFETPEGPLFVKGAIVGGVADIPARATFLNMKQHNGIYGCHKCKIRSVQLQPGRGQKRVYLFERNLTMRTDEETERYAAQAVALNSDVYGVKGHTIMRRLVHQPVRSTSCDEMHPIYQGLVKKMLHLWFDEKHRNGFWSLHPLVEVVDSRLCAVSPPDFVQRLPRSIKEHVKYWKASELKAWLFYYSLPVLNGIMQPLCFNHWKLLVLGVFLLSKNSISNDDITLSSKLLTEFVCRFAVIYDQHHMTCNLHQLLHLPSVVKDLGPLWAHSCFPFEDLNGKLLKLVTGTRFADLQISNAAALFLNLSTAKNEKLRQGRPAKAYCEKLCNFKRKLKLASISPVFSVAGKLLKVAVLPGLVEDTLALSGIQGTTFHMFYRLFHRLESLLFTSESYNRLIKTNNTCVKFLDGNASAFGVIQSFVRVSNCPCHDICNDCNADFYAIVRKCNYEDIFDALPRVKIPFIHKIFLLNEFSAININQLTAVCFSVRINRETTFFLEPVNNVEVE